MSDPGPEIRAAVPAAPARDGERTPSASAPAPAADDRCANCGTPLVGAFCHACGQRGHVHRSVLHLVEELLHGVFHFEGRAWRTLPSLFFRPGELTRRYVHGERTRFVSPLGLFLFSVFLLFLGFGAPGGADGAKVGVIAGQQAGQGRSIEDIRAELAKDVSGAEERVRVAKEELEGARAAGRPTGELEARLRKANEDLTVSRLIHESVGASTPEGAVGRLATHLDTGHPSFDRAVLEKLQNPDLLFYELKSKAYKLSWTLIPISLPFIWLLFCFRRDVHLYDHAIFALYSLSFVSMFVALMALVARVPVVGHAATPIVLLGIPVHLFAHLKGAYRLTAGAAAWRTVVMLGLAQLWLVLFFVLIVAVDLWH